MGRYHSGAMYRTSSIPTLSPVPALVRYSKWLSVCSFVVGTIGWRVEIAIFFWVYQICRFQVLNLCFSGQKLQLLVLSLRPIVALKKEKLWSVDTPGCTCFQKILLKSRWWEMCFVWGKVKGVGSKEYMYITTNRKWVSLLTDKFICNRAIFIKYVYFFPFHMHR